MKLAVILLPFLAATASAQDCTKVSVEGDATFCIKGPICSGRDDDDGKEVCPKVGDVAVEACRPENPSYNKATGKCVAPVPAQCLLLKTGAYGCVWDLGKPAPAPAPTPAPTNQQTPAPANCEKVSVVGDATFCIKGPICAGTDDNDGKELCPQVGDVAVEACRPENPSYNKATGKCTAPVPAQCLLLPTGAYGCIWDLSKLPAPTPAWTTTSAPTQTTKAPTPTPATTSPAPTTKAPTPAPSNNQQTPAPTTKAPTPAPSNNQQTPAPTTKAPTTPASSNNQQTPVPPPKTNEPTVAPGCTNVTVKDDSAVFCIMGPICEGPKFDDGKENCPRVGDYAIDSCFSTNPSHDPKSQYCRAPVDAQCLLQPSGVYACEWPSSKGVTFNALATGATGASGASATGSTAGIVVGTVAAVAAVGIAVVGTIMYKKHVTKTAEPDAVSVEMVTGATPRSPEFRQV